MRVSVDQKFDGGELINEQAQAEGVYIILEEGLIGYSVSTDTAPASVEIAVNGETESIPLQKHAEYPSVSVAEVALPTGRPVKATVQGVTEHIYRASTLPNDVDRSHEVGEGYDVILTPEAQTQVRSFAFQAANALNNGSAWSDIKAPRPPKAPVRLVKQDLVGFTKIKWAEADTVEAGDVLSHDNGTTKGLWRADTATTAEPAKGSADWTLVFEITV